MDPSARAAATAASHIAPGDSAAAPAPAADLSSASSPAASGGHDVAGLLFEVYLAYRDQFDLVTRRAEGRFRNQDWTGRQGDAHERLLLYSQFVTWVQRDIASLMGEHGGDRATWRRLKSRYADLTQGRRDCEIARTFFNSVSRRVRAMGGVDPWTEFLDDEYYGHAHAEDLAISLHRVEGTNLDVALSRLLADLSLTDVLVNPDGEARSAADAFRAELVRLGHDGPVTGLEMLDTVFYRSKAAYVVGRATVGEAVVPLVLALVHGPAGLVVDAVLVDPDDVSVVFSFTRSYFHADTPDPGGVVRFLSPMMPGKGAHELYTAIGFNRHGKSELYRSLRAQLAQGNASFDWSEGEPGLVMTVFRCPALQTVFKVIRDRFGAPKHTTRRTVLEKYHLVFVHDRVGRLADAQEFEDLEFRRDWFAPDLLAELEVHAGQTVRVEGDRVVIGHLYTERQVEPLNVFLARAEPEEAARAIRGYGDAIRDLAAANIFTGDMLLKNFGVTRHGRVIFYDYDELCLLTDCRFRTLPEAPHPDDEMSAEPWFHIGESDVFPEQFRPFLVPAGALGDVFLEAHADLLRVEWWREMQDRHRAGEVVEFFPYPEARRLRRH
jgi:isocitrate dehydrogenase kinase/phosphatase